MMVRYHTYTRFLIMLLLLCSLPAAVRAAGTPAGTFVTNVVSVSATVAGVPLALSTSTSFVVAERIDLALTWQDASSVPVAAGQTSAVTTYLLTNTGNGIDSYTLAATGNGIGGDQFDPAVTSIYLDSDGNNTFDPGVDAPYTAATGTIAADASRTVFVLSTIPSTTLTTGDLGIVQLVATSSTGTGPPGTIVGGAGEGGTDAVVGMSQGTQTAAGSYVILTVTAVNAVKAVTVLDPSGGSQPYPGATLRYSIVVTVSGPDTANAVTITDPIPANTTYRSGSLRLNGTPLTDGVDVPTPDAGDFNVTTPGAVTVHLGDMTAASPVQTINFEVTID